MAESNRPLPLGKLVLSAGSLLLLAVCGCGPGTGPAGGPAAPEAKEYVYFPALPDPARVQFLCNLRGSVDFEEKAGRKGGLAGFVLGEEEGEKYDIIGKPYGVAVRDGKVYVADTLNVSVAVLDMRERRFDRFGKKGLGKLRKPINIRFGPDGLCYVTDTVPGGQVVVFDGSGKFVRKYVKPDEFKPADIALSEKELFVLDIDGGTIKVYDLASGQLKRTFGKKGTGLGEFNGPTNMVLGPDGNLFVTDSINQRVQKLSPDGKPLAVIGQFGRGPGKFFRPKGIAVDRTGLIYVADAVVGIVQLFDPRGEALMYFGGQGRDPGQLLLPTQVAIDYDNVELFRKYIAPDFQAEYLLFVTNQYGDNRVSVFAFGTRKGPTPQPASRPA